MIAESRRMTQNLPPMNPTLPPPPYNELYWILSETVILMSSVFSVYILICLLRHSCTVRCKSSKEINKRKEKFLYQMCMLSVVMALGRLFADHTVAFLGWQSDVLCAISVSVSFVLYSCSLYPVYIFLWVKQSILCTYNQ